MTNYRYADLTKADFYSENLQEADFSYATLAGADFESADLRSVRFEEADLRGANLKDADARCAEFTGADLRGANLVWANLNGADLRGAALEGVIAWESEPNLTKLPRILWEHTLSIRYSQNHWGSRCDTLCCLAGRAAEYSGRPASSGHGIIAILKAMPGFRLEVLYQSDPGVALEELRRFL